MSEEFGPTFITVTDEDGNEIALEFIDALEYNGQNPHFVIRDAGSARGSQASRLPSAAGSWKR